MRANAIGPDVGEIGVPNLWLNYPGTYMVLVIGEVTSQHDVHYDPIICVLDDQLRTILQYLINVHMYG